GKKYYWEVTINSGTSAYIGIADNTVPLDKALDQSPNAYGAYMSGYYIDNSTVVIPAPQVKAAAGSTVMVAFDPAGGKLWFGVNGVWDGDPGENLNPGLSGIKMKGKLFYPVIAHKSDNTTVAFAPMDFKYAPPQGFGVSQVEDWDNDGLS
ncbi:SPRY domain-containing protein, partial [Saccharophagus degradans]